ncbi:sperm-associated antigen 4 protein isoform X11 [Pipistrellus kuhlii]|uniref:sperm-associated antigen 4 protein isoform X11 n=1 Tax=Pipistrellus kuhlii TaxID=59472 RepID=UPI001E26EA89|nr:sperm-associated antigen 4 protein isoform X11 [Pipistrellus kuhlii]
MRRGPRPGSAASPHKQAPNFYSDNSNSSVSTTSGDSSGHRSAGPGPGEPEGRRAQGSSCGEPALSPGLPGGAPRSHSAPTAEGAATLRGGASEPAGSPVVSEEQFHLLAALDLRQEMQPPRVFKSFLSPLFQVLSVCVSPLGDVLVSVYREVCSIRFLLTAVSLLSLFLTALGWGVLYLVPPLESGANHPVPTSRLQRVPRARAHAGAAAAAAAGRAGQAPPGGVQRPRSQQRGASIDLEKTSRDYEDQNGAYFWNRFSFWNYARPPMVILEPDVFPGNCWAFEGDQGQVVIRLPGRVQLSDITLQHPPPSVAHTGGANSAPRDFAVYGLQVDDETEVFLGKFTFDMEKSEIQTFRLQNDPPTAFPKVKIQILSNWGHPHFTCLYRVRAHGMRTSEEAGDSATGGPN